METVVATWDPANYRRVHERIKKLFRDGEIENVWHAQWRAAQRGISDLDVREVILGGRITDHSCPNGMWRYVLDGRLLDGGRLRVVVELDSRLVVITVVRRR